MIPLWMDHPFLGLIHQDQDNPPLDRSLEEDLPSDAMDDWRKTSHGNHKEGPTLGWAKGEDMLLIQDVLKGLRGPRSFK